MNKNNKKKGKMKDDAQACNFNLVVFCFKVFALKFNRVLSLEARAESLFLIFIHCLFQVKLLAD